MDEQRYAFLAGRASDLVLAGDREGAIEILEQLVQSDLPVFDRAMMCMNIAIVNDQMGDSLKALETYSRAVALECETGSHFIAQHRAAHLGQLGRYDDSILAYEELLTHGDLEPESREMFLKNIETLRQLKSQP